MSNEECDADSSEMYTRLQEELMQQIKVGRSVTLTLVRCTRGYKKNSCSRLRSVILMTNYIRQCRKSSVIGND